MDSNQPPPKPPKGPPLGDHPKEPADHGKAKKKQGHQAHLTAAADVLQVLLQK